MPIHNEVAVGSLLILANPGLDQRSVFHRGKTKGHIFAHSLQRCLAEHALAGSRIERPAARVIGDFEAAPIASWDAVEETLAVVAPHWKMRVGEPQVSGGRSEEENILLGWLNKMAQSFREQFT